MSSGPEPIRVSTCSQGRSFPLPWPVLFLSLPACLPAWLGGCFAWWMAYPQPTKGLHGRAWDMLLSELASSTSAAVQHLVTPSTVARRFPFHERLIFHVYTISVQNVCTAHPSPQCTYPPPKPPMHE